MRVSAARWSALAAALSLAALAASRASADDLSALRARAESLAASGRCEEALEVVAEARGLGELGLAEDMKQPPHEIVGAGGERDNQRTVSETGRNRKSQHQRERTTQSAPHENHAP